MSQPEIHEQLQIVEDEWVPLPGGELEGRRPRGLCHACRSRRLAGLPSRPLCFECYRAANDRERRLQAAANLNTATSERFAVGSPFEPVDKPRLLMLRVARQRARVLLDSGPGACAAKRRRSQIAARHALDQDIPRVESFAAPCARLTIKALPSKLASFLKSDLELPESWLPFVAGNRQ